MGSIVSIMKEMKDFFRTVPVSALKKNLTRIIWTDRHWIQKIYVMAFLAKVLAYGIKKIIRPGLIRLHSILSYLASFFNKLSRGLAKVYLNFPVWLVTFNFPKGGSDNTGGGKTTHE